jgi:hypothetical protein
MGEQQDQYGRQDSISTSQNNAGYYAATALQIRLDTSLIVRQIEMYLKGERTILVDVNGDGTLDTKVIWKGKPLVSDEGLQNLMMFVECIFNPQVVQANFPDSKKMDGYIMYAKYLKRTRMDISEHLMKNLKNYGIDEKNYNGVISTLMRFIEAFMTRALYNKERESYANTIQTRENVNTVPQRGGFKFPFMN